MMRHLQVNDKRLVTGSLGLKRNFTHLKYKTIIILNKSSRTETFGGIPM